MNKFTINICRKTFISHGKQPQNYFYPASQGNFFPFSVFPKEEWNVLSYKAACTLWSKTFDFAIAYNIQAYAKELLILSQTLLCFGSLRRSHECLVFCRTDILWVGALKAHVMLYPRGVRLTWLFRKVHGLDQAHRDPFPNHAGSSASDTLQLIWDLCCTWHLLWAS